MYTEFFFMITSSQIITLIERDDGKEKNKIVET